MLLFRPSKPLRDRFLRIFGPSRPPKPRISLDKVDVFDVFTIFASHSLFALSSGLLRSIFGSSGRIWDTSWDNFSWPKRTSDIEDPFLFDVHVPKFASDLPNGAPGTPERPQNVPKCAPKAPNYVSPELLHNHYSFLLQSYLPSTTY